MEVSQYSTDSMVTPGVYHGQAPGVASTQEDVVGAAEVYPYTTAAPTMSSVRGTGAWSLRSPLGVGQGAHQRRRGGNGTTHTIQYKKQITLF